MAVLYLPLIVWNTVACVCNGLNLYQLNALSLKSFIQLISLDLHVERAGQSYFIKYIKCPSKIVPVSDLEKVVHPHGCRTQGC